MERFAVPRRYHVNGQKGQKVEINHNTCSVFSQLCCQSGVAVK